MYATIADACASVICGCAGITTWPHTPDPPFRIFLTRRAVALVSPRYRRATAVYEGPTDCLLTWWQDRHVPLSMSRLPASCAAGTAADACPL
jgi:hypothetical protein